MARREWIAPLHWDRRRLACTGVTQHAICIHEGLYGKALEARRLHRRYPTRNYYSVGPLQRGLCRRDACGGVTQHAIIIQ